EVAYQKWMKEGDAALSAKKFAEAAKAYDEALKQKPGDPAATKGKKAALDGMKPPPKPPVKPADPKGKQAKEDYDLAMSAARAAMKNKNYQGAVNAYAEALRKMPGDKTAAAEKAEAEKQLAAVAYQNWMKQGDAALAAKKFAEAAKAYDEALKIKPGDPAAI